MFAAYVSLFLIIKVTARQLGCLSEVVFISTDVTIERVNLTANQCACHSVLGNYSGFNYYANNQTCQLFVNFTNDFELLVELHTQFCFIDKAPGKD